MPQNCLSFENQEQLRVLFGCQDEYLKQVRERVGVQVVVRGGELRLSGSPEQIATGYKVLNELKAVVRRHGELYPTEVDRILTRHMEPVVDRAHPDASLREKAGSSGTHSLHRRPSLPRSDRPGLNGGTMEDTQIDLHEKARTVKPRTSGQERYVQAIRGNDLVFCIGPAGTGKTYLAVAMALHALRTEQVRKIVLVRPAVEAGEKLGFLPGDMLAKVNPYLRPLLDALADMVTFEQVRRYMENDVIEILPLAFMRGRTLNETFIILDEAQNTTITQMKMFLTRMGERSKIVVTGDPTQIDLPPSVRSGLSDAVERLRGIPGVEAIELSGQDIVRHRLVREIVRAYDDEDKTSHSSHPSRRK